MRSFSEIASRVGLRLGDVRYLAFCCVVALGLVAILNVFPPPVESMVGEGSAMRSFVGLGINGTSIVMAAIYGIINTGFAEEFLFRGMIAGSLSRRLTIFWANLWQSVIFLLPHLLILFVMPELWWILFPIFAGSLLAGWVRIKSGSFVGPWIIHASVNITMCLLIAAGT